MKRTITQLMSIALLALAAPAAAQTGVFCDTTSNIVIYSNYDGGTLTINVDQNIPNLKIGVVSYEYSVITIQGPFASNVTQVWYAGYDGSNNHCNLSPPHTSSISGVPNSVDTITLYPPATMSDPNGWSNIICAYQCAGGNQGGCNTVEQVADFFMTKFGGNSIRYHRTQYGCWPANAVNISAGGNCCLLPIGTGLSEQQQLEAMKLYPNPAAKETFVELDLKQAAEGKLTLVDMLGREVMRRDVRFEAGNNKINLNTEMLPAGLYLLKLQAGENSAQRKLEVR